jgi:hypothetical protein
MSRLVERGSISRSRCPRKFILMHLRTTTFFIQTFSSSNLVTSAFLSLTYTHKHSKRKDAAVGENDNLHPQLSSSSFQYWDRVVSGSYKLVSFRSQQPTLSHPICIQAKLFHPRSSKQRFIVFRYGVAYRSCVRRIFCVELTPC